MQRASFDCTATEFAQQQLAEGQLPGVLLLRFPPLREFLRRHRSSTMASRSSALLRSRNTQCRISSGASPSATAAHSAKEGYTISNLLLSCIAIIGCCQCMKVVSRQKAIWHSFHRLLHPRLLAFTNKW